MITLALDASTYAGSVAVVDGPRVLAEATTAMRGMHEERLMPAVAAALADANLAVSAVERIVCGAGPGSFTSLRIASGIAKGIATGLDIPLFGVPSLALIVAGARLPRGRYLAALDALREEWYVGLYEVAAGGVDELEGAHLIPAATVEVTAARLGARVVGPAFEGEHAPHARGVVGLHAMLDRLGPVDLATWEPRYGRLAEAQVRWEAVHGRPLSSA